MTASRTADVYKNGVLAARLERRDGGVEFTYRPEYLAGGGQAIASTLPTRSESSTSAGGAVPAFFAGLLPEGRRLTALRREVKTSADDEFSLLIAVGADTIGDVQVVATGASLPSNGETIRIEKSFAEVRFADLLDETGMSLTPRLAGVQDKVSATMISVPVAQRNERYIVKLNPPENPYLVENEAFFLDLARGRRMPVAKSRVVYDLDGTPGLLVTRFDRIWSDNHIEMLAVEDACQAMGLWPADKYNVTMEDAALALLALTPARPVAAREILRQLSYAWLTGNGDLHAKNIAVVNSPAVGQRISPAYDLPSTLFYDDATLALTVGGRDTLSARRVLSFAAELGLLPKAIQRTIHDVLDATADLPERLTAAQLPFSRTTTDKVSRQLATRHRDIRAALSD